MEACGHTPIWEGQRVERTNACGRHTYVPAFKRWIVQQALRPGVSVAGLALSNQVNANQLRRWVMLHQRAWPSGSQALLPVSIAPEPAATERTLQGEERIEIVVAEIVVRVPTGAQASTLRTVLEVLRGNTR